MRSPADPPARRALGLLPLLLVLLSACAEVVPVPTAPSPTPAIPAPAAPSPTAPSSGAPDAAGIPLPTPGRPWDGATLLREMAASTRPGGVPDEVETPEIAEAIAATIWTVDGTAWDTMAIGGFCGDVTCTIDLSGGHLGRAGEDLWTLEIDVATGRVDPVVAELRSLPWELVDALDELVRASDPASVLDGMMLTTARWLPPPDGDRFVLSYRAGGEEGSCRREATVDARWGELVQLSATNC